MSGEVAVPGGALFNSTDGAVVPLLVGMGRGVLIGRRVGAGVLWGGGPETDEVQMPVAWIPRVRDGVTAVEAVGTTAREGPLRVFGFDVPLSGPDAPRSRGEARSFPDGSAVAGDDALWLLFDEDGRQVLARLDSFAGPEQRWDLGPSAAQRLEDADLERGSPRALLRSADRRYEGWTERDRVALPADAVGGALIHGAVLVARPGGFERLPL